MTSSSWWYARCQPTAMPLRTPPPPQHRMGPEKRRRGRRKIRWTLWVCVWILSWALMNFVIALFFLFEVVLSKSWTHLCRLVWYIGRHMTINQSDFTIVIIWPSSNQIVVTWLCSAESKQMTAEGHQYVIKLCVQNSPVPRPDCIVRFLGVLPPFPHTVSDIKWKWICGTAAITCYRCNSLFTFLSKAVERLENWNSFQRRRKSYP